MTLDEVKDRVPSSITIMPPPRRGVIDIMLDGFYVGFLYDTPEGMYFKTLWIESKNWDDVANVKRFLSRFEYALLLTVRYHRYTYRIYRLIK